MISTQKSRGGKLQNHRPWSVIYPLSQEDSATVLSMALWNGSRFRKGVTFEAATVRGISGWWAKPPRGKKRAAIRSRP
jgi:hypothetical protein